MPRTLLLHFSYQRDAVMRGEELPSGPCSAKRNNQSVRNEEGDLMLCKSCNAERHHVSRVEET